MDERQFYIVSVNHTRREHPYITVWRPDNKGYAFPLSWAGRYPESIVAESLGYYHDGGNIAVPCEVLDAICTTPSKGMIDNNAGPVVLNNKSTWFDILYAPAWPLPYTPYPEYKGARRQKVKS